MTILSRRHALIGMAGAAVPLCAARARVAGQPARIGLLTAQTAAAIAPSLPFLRSGLAEEGFAEGRGLTIEYRYGNDSLERVVAHARELVESRVELLVVQGPAVASIVALNLPIPLIYVTSADPVAAGYAKSLAQPIGEKSGLTFMAFEFASKRLEMLREVMPAVERVVVFGNPEHQGTQTERAFSESSGQRLGMDVRFHPTSVTADLDVAFARVKQEGMQAISLLADGFAGQNRHIVLKFAAEQGIPVVSGWPVFAQSGALFTYGPRLESCYRRLAYYVARVLRGTPASELPIERPSVFQTVINQTTARKLGVGVSRAFLARADEVIG
jgi:putative ABC transport system substrate-binding protein